MDQQFEQMFSAVKKYNEADRTVRENQRQNRETKRAENAKKANESPWRERNEAVVSKLEALGFEILSFDDNKTSGGSYEPLGVYKCRRNGWVFDAYDRPDPDIPNMLQVYAIKHVKTGEEIRYYTDLNGHNTSLNKVQNLLRIMEIGCQGYIEEKYAIYQTLAEKLREKGFAVKDENFVFDLEKSVGTLNVSGIAQIGVDAGSGEATLWINSKSGDFHFSRRYGGEQDIDDLASYLKFAIEQMEGRYGYLENGDFRKNEDVEALFDNDSKYEQLDLDKEGTLVIYDTTEGWRYNEAEYAALEAEREINHANGVEIYKSYHLRINDRRGYLEDCIGQDFYFEFFYNRNFDKDRCVFSVEHSAYHNKKKEGVDIAYSRWDYEDERLERSGHEYRGSFSQCLKAFADFLKALVQANGLEISIEFQTNAERFLR